MQRQIEGKKGDAGRIDTRQAIRDRARVAAMKGPGRKVAGKELKTT
jgi:hypothetical protein